MDIGRKLADLERRLAAVEGSQRLSHASIDNTAVEVRDGQGSLRGLLGVQADGTTALNVVNGPPPPQPTQPVLASVLGGVAASWDGTFEDGATLPLDWQRLEVHASTSDGFTPSPDTLKATIETPRGSTAVVVTSVPVYVRLVARSTSGTASTPSAQAGPLGPQPVVADTILDGIVTEVKLADDAVTAAKIAAGAVGTSELADAAVHAQQLADAAVEVGKIADNAVTGPAIASEAVSAGKIAANAVTAVKIAANAVTAQKVAAGAITTDKLTVTGGANILTDPSFEGAYTASLVAGSTFASQDTTKGNGSPTSLKIDATNATPAFRSVALTSVATMPGEQWHLAVDYWASTNWAGAEISIHARWETATGAVLSYSKVLTTTPVREEWTRLAGTVTAPAGVDRLVCRVESGSGTAGIVWFDNAVVRPVLGGTQIQDGAITTEKIITGAIQAGQIAAGAVLAEKIASGAVTTAKLDALAVTADKIAANAITVEKLAAGSVDATALAADAVTGKTISGGTITGALIQTAATGERVVLNETGGNNLLVYNSDGVVVASLTPGGVGLRGTTGNVMAISPSTANPSIRWANAAQTKFARVQAVTNSTELDLQLENSTGRSLHLLSTLAHFDGVPLQVTAPTDLTGALLTLNRSGTKLTVDKDGNLTASGAVSAGSVSTTGAVSAGSVTATGSMTSANAGSGTVNAVMNAVSSVDVTVNFGKTFPAVPQVVCSLRGNPTLPGNSSALFVRPFNITTTGCTVRVHDINGVARTLTHAVDWIARSA
ncbi:H-type lectin domain-containing protein [Streptomyces pilosus]|uniref:H-type lectin domain-containing protein n=1 Tax=Streptomyces pilosus TaxID=28893 RepID=UPI0036337744